MLEPEKIAVLHVAGFLATALAWQVSTPGLALQPDLTEPVVASEVINHYRQAETPYSSGHRGVDYAVDLGQGVFAPADAVVHFVGTVVDRPLISLRHSGDLLTSFEPVCSKLLEGEQVVQGDLIGEVCEAEASYSQHCTSITCLHFSVRKSGEYLSPLWFIGDLEPSRLLPWIEPGI